MIHSLSGGVIADYEKLIYVFVQPDELSGQGKMWYISPYPRIKCGDKVLITCGRRQITGSVLRVETVTKQTAPYPVNRTREIDAII